jgi:hypothetical protein
MTKTAWSYYSDLVSPLIKGEKTDDHYLTSLIKQMRKEGYGEWAIAESLYEHACCEFGSDNKGYNDSANCIQISPEKWVHLTIDAIALDEELNGCE